VSDYPRHVASDKKIPWIATLHVRPLPGQSGGLEGCAGAYAVVLALARDEAEYREIAAAEMVTLVLLIAEIEDASPFEPHTEDPENVRQCAARLSPEWPVQYNDFPAYPHDQA
jgi:hypothetical protein